MRRHSKAPSVNKGGTQLGSNREIEVIEIVEKRCSRSGVTAEPEQAAATRQDRDGADFF